MESSLANDKSYGRGVVEYHRKHPNKRNDDVTVTWSTADYVAMAIANENLEGEWAKPSDQLSFLPDNLKVDPHGRPFCVIQRPDSIIVLAYWNKTPIECTFDATKHIDDSHAVSGDMEFSGRTDYWIYVLKTARMPAEGCVLPWDLFIIRLDKQARRFFLEATEPYLSLGFEIRSRLKGLDAFVQRCEPSWRETWSASFFSVSKLAGYKTDPDISEAVKNGEWGKAYVGEYDRESQVLTILPLDSAKPRTRRVSIVFPENATRYFKEDGGTGAMYVALASNGGYTVTAREHMFVRIEESGRWSKTGSRIAFVPTKSGASTYDAEEASYKGHVFLALEGDSGPSIEVPIAEIKHSLDENSNELPLYIFFEVSGTVYEEETKQTYPFHTRTDVR